MTTSERVAVIGTGLIGTSIALAASRAGDQVRGWDPDSGVLSLAVDRSELTAASSLEEAVRGATLTFICAPVDSIPPLAVEALDASTASVVTDVGSVKSHVVLEVEAKAGSRVGRFVGGHPMGGSERSGPDHASAAILDGSAWVLTPSRATDPAAVERLSTWVARIGARPMQMDADRHDRLIAVVSHLPQVAATSLMALAATDEGTDPEILRLAAGGFRDLTRLAASDPDLWSAILLANREEVATAIERYVSRLSELRRLILDRDVSRIARVFAEAKAARLTLAAKPQVRAGVAVVQVPVPDRPGVLADVTTAMSAAGVNIEDLQIVHSPEGGRGNLHLTIAASSVDAATEALREHWFEPLRIA